MMLGDLLSHTHTAAAVMPEALRAEIEATGVAPESFARAAVAAFERRAAAEDWALLITRVRESPDPGGACLEAMCRWHLDSLKGWRPS